MTASRPSTTDRKSTRLNSSHTVIYTLSLHDALPILPALPRLSLLVALNLVHVPVVGEHTETDDGEQAEHDRSEEHTSELQSHSDLHSFPTRRSSDLTGSSTAFPPRRAEPRPCTGSRRAHRDR